MGTIRNYLAAGAACLFVVAGQGLHPAHAQSPTARQQVQHLLRRFSFSATPQIVTGVQSAGIAAWLAQQANWSALDDSKSELETIPTTGTTDTYLYERMVQEHMLLTPRQLQAKLELHWLDHFSVGEQKVGLPNVFYQYDQTVRANALGNFASLLSQVSVEGAMLKWLDNNNNKGPVANENFAREVMQLYATGLYQLNDDGSQVLGPDNQPLLNYSQVDVQNLALAVTGYSLVIDATNANPLTNFKVSYVPGNHYTGTISFFGKTQTIPNNSTAMQVVCGILATQPSTAPFQVTEMLQRFVTERPSPQYISDIVQVWRATQSAPDQIAQVITAIVNHKLFNASYHSMARQPVEFLLDTLRVLPANLQASATTGPGYSILSASGALAQRLFFPASVFSFYRPGGLAGLTNTATVLGRTSITASITSNLPTSTSVDTYVNMPALRAAIGSVAGTDIATYLLDAFLDGGTPAQAALVNTILTGTPTDNQVRAAIWLLLNSPDYAVN